jgi:hypothetical protein
MRKAPRRNIFPENYVDKDLMASQGRKVREAVGLSYIGTAAWEVSLEKH